MVPLGDVAVIDRRGVTPEEIPSGTTYVGLEHIQSGGSFVGVGTVFAGDLASSKFAFTPAHLLYGKLRPYLAKIALPDFEGVCSTDILPVRPSQDLDRRYLGYFLRQPHQVVLANSLATGANLPRLSPSALERIRIPLLPVGEQRRIAAILNKADELRAKRREALAYLDTLTQSTFDHMFGDGSKRSVEWPTATLETVALQITDGEHQTPRRETEGIKLLSARNIRNGDLDFSSVDYVGADEYVRISRRCKPQKGDVLISCSGTIGRVAAIQTNEPFTLVRSVAMVRPDPRVLLPSFLERQLLTPALQRQMQRRANTSSQANLFQGPIRGLTIFLPPLKVQQRFADRVAAVGCLKNQQRAQLRELNALFASLEHRAFKGEL